MSATIVTVSGDKRIQLLNSQIIRRPIILSNWTTIRIGVLVDFPSAASVTGGPNILIGMGSGLTNGIGDATTTNWIGMANVSDMTLTVGPPNFSNPSFKTRKKVATTITDTASASLSARVSMAQSAPNIFIVEITKGSPNYSVNICTPTTQAGAQTAATVAQLVQMLEIGAGVFTSGNVAAVVAGYSVSGAQTLAMSEVAGVLDAIQIYWDRTSIPMEISAVYYRKVA